MVALEQRGVGVVAVAARLDGRSTWIRAWTAHISALVLFTLLMLAHAPAIVFHPTDTLMPDLIDPLYCAWAVASAVHNVAHWRDGLWSLFNANIYYPTPHAAAFGDVYVGILPLSLPIHALVGNPIALLNALVALSFVLSAYGAFVLGSIVTRSYWAGLVAGVVFGFCPLRTEHLGHLNILSTEWLVAATVCVVVAWRRDRVRWWVLVGLFAGLAAVSNLYYLAYLAVPALVVAGVAARRWTRQRLVGGLLATGIAALFVGPFMIPYATRHAALDPTYGVASSTDVLSFVQVLQGRSLDSIALPAVPLQIMQLNHGFFPGFVALFLVFLAWRQKRGRLWALFAGACAVLALGPAIQVDGHALSVPLPYAALERVVPYFTLFRDPPRALIGFYLGLAIVCAWGAREALHALPHRKARIAWGILIAGLVTVELWSPMPVRSVAAIPAGELWLARQPHIHTILELPIASTTPLDWQRQSEIMYDSTAHWKMLVNGSASVEPAGMAARRAILGAYPSTASIAMLKTIHVDAVVLRLTWLTSAQRAAARRACHVAYQDRLEDICIGPWAPDA